MTRRKSSLLRFSFRKKIYNLKKYHLDPLRLPEPCDCRKWRAPSGKWTRILSIVSVGEPFAFSNAEIKPLYNRSPIAIALCWGGWVHGTGPQRAHKVSLLTGSGFISRLWQDFPALCINCPFQICKTRTASSDGHSHNGCVVRWLRGLRQNCFRPDQAP